MALEQGSDEFHASFQEEKRDRERPGREAALRGGGDDSVMRTVLHLETLVARCPSHGQKMRRDLWPQLLQLMGQHEVVE